MSNTIETMAVDLILNNSAFNTGIQQSIQMLQRFNTQLSSMTNSLNASAFSLNSLSSSSNHLGANLNNASNGLNNLGSNANNAGNSVNGLIGNLGRMADKLQQIGTQATMTLTLPILALGAGMVHYASDTNEALNKVDVSFKRDAQAVRDWSETTLESIGLARGSALDMASLYGDMATSMGFATDKASDMSMSLTQLAGDLASFKNIGFGQAQTALSAIFTGETESLKRLGIVMTQVNLENWAMANGMKSNIKEMTQMEQVQLRYNYVMAMTKNAQGDFARTSDSTANLLRKFGESMKELGANFGQLLLPTVNKIVTALNGMLKVLGDLPKPVKEFILVGMGIVAIVGPLMAITGIVMKLRLLWIANGVAIQAMSATAITGIRALATSLSTALLTPGGAVLAMFAGIVAVAIQLRNVQKAQTEELLRQEEVLKRNKELKEGMYKADADAYQRSLDENARIIEAYNKLVSIQNKGMSYSQFKSIETNMSDSTMFGGLNNSMKDMFATDEQKKLNAEAREVIKTLKDLGLTVDDARARFEANKDNIRQYREELARLQKMVGGLNDSERKELTTKLQEYNQIDSHTQKVQENIDAYINLSNMKNKNSKESEDMSKAEEYLTLVLGNNIIKYDQNGKAIGLNITKLKDLKTQYINTKDALKGGIDIMIKSNLAEIQTNLIKNQAELDTLSKKPHLPAGVAGPQLDGGYVTNKIEELKTAIETGKKSQKELLELADSIKDIGSSSDYSSSGGSGGGGKPKKTPEELMRERVQNALDLYNYKKNLDRLSLKEQLDNLEQVKKLAWNGSKEQMDIEVQIHEKKKEIEQKAINDSISAIEHKYNIGRMSSQEYYDALTKHQKKYSDWYKKNVMESYALDEKIFQQKQQMNNDLFDKYKKNLEKARDIENENLQLRKEALDEDYKNNVKRIEDERDAKVKAFQEQIDAIDKASKKEDRDREIAQAKQLINQYKNSLTEEGQKKYLYYKNIIRDGTNEQIKEDVRMQIDITTKNAQIELDRKQAKYDSDSKILDYQQKALSKVYSKMEEDASKFSDKYLWTYNQSVEQIKTGIEKSMSQETVTHVASVNKMMTTLSDTVVDGFQGIITAVAGMFTGLDVLKLPSLDLSAVNTANPALAIGAGAYGNTTFNFNIQNMEVRKDSDVVDIAKELVGYIRDKR